MAKFGFFLKRFFHSQPRRSSFPHQRACSLPLPSTWTINIALLHRNSCHAVDVYRRDARVGEIYLFGTTRTRSKAKAIRCRPVFKCGANPTGRSSSSMSSPCLPVFFFPCILKRPKLPPSTSRLPRLTTRFLLSSASVLHVSLHSITSSSC